MEKKVRRIRKTKHNAKTITYGIVKMEFPDSSFLSGCDVNDADSIDDIYSPSEPCSGLLVGDIIWSKTSGHNFWPSMVAYEPNTAVYFQTSTKHSMPIKYHVQFFGKKALRGWVNKSTVLRFQGREHFLGLSSHHSAPPNQREVWEEAVNEAEAAMLLDRKERKLAYVFNYSENQGKKIRKPSIKKGPASMTRAVKEGISPFIERRTSLRLSQDSKSSTSLETNEPCDNRGESLDGSQRVKTRKCTTSEVKKSTELRQQHQLQQHQPQHHQQQHQQQQHPQQLQQQQQQQQQQQYMMQPLQRGQKEQHLQISLEQNPTSVVEKMSESPHSIMAEDRLVLNKVLTDHVNNARIGAVYPDLENNSDSGIEDVGALEDVEGIAGKQLQKCTTFDVIHTNPAVTDVCKSKPKEKEFSLEATSIEGDSEKENSKENWFTSLKSKYQLSNERNIKSSESASAAKSSTCTGRKRKVASFNFQKSPVSSELKVYKENKSVPGAVSSEDAAKAKKLKSTAVLSSKLQESNASKKTILTDMNNNKLLPKDKVTVNLPKVSKLERKNQYCTICEDPNGELVYCNGTCLSQFHASCIGLSFIPKDFTCDECTSGLHSCFLCGKVGELTKCSQLLCGKYYHAECLMENPLTRYENKAKTKFTCPQHSCCYCHDKKHVKHSGKRFLKCVKCPLAYHFAPCMPAGCSMLTPTQMICDEHYCPSKTNMMKVNTTWCFICSNGGSLVCCDKCPASFHLECLPSLTSVPTGAWQCDDCRNGVKVRYGDIVWVKYGNFRWWPAQICFPEEVPTNILNLRHTIGEFPVQFFGTKDYAWLNSGRLFKYAEGDTGSGLGKSYLDKPFQRGLDEVKIAFAAKKKMLEDEEAVYETKQANKPPSYGHLKVNRPVSCVQTVLDRSEWPICHCKSEDPCRNECLNKMLYYECSALLCPNGDSCANQRMQKGLFAKTKIFKCKEKGWGLKAEEEIKVGDFVIEYVGELIDEATCHNRIKQYHEMEVRDYYFLTIDKDNIIDAYPRGNLARFMNHSCDPNCETQKWTVNGEVRVGLFATRDINIGEELCFNYHLDCLGNDKKQCKCGAANCSGFLGEKPKSDKALSDKRKIKKKKRKKKVKLVHEDECFSCGDGGELLLCDRTNCTKAYHQDCLIMDEPPKGRWSCPWHFCDECGKMARSMCSLCPNSFCANHLDGQMTELSEDVLVCPAHNEEELVSLRKLSVENSTQLMDIHGVIESSEVPPKKRRKKSMILEGKENIDLATGTSNVVAHRVAQSPVSTANQSVEIKDEKNVPEISAKDLAPRVQRLKSNGKKVIGKKIFGKKKGPLKGKKTRVLQGAPQSSVSSVIPEAEKMLTNSYSIVPTTNNDNEITNPSDAYAEMETLIKITKVLEKVTTNSTTTKRVIKSKAKFSVPSTKHSSKAKMKSEAVKRRPTKTKDMPEETTTKSSKLEVSNQIKKVDVKVVTTEVMGKVANTNMSVVKSKPKLPAPIKRKLPDPVCEPLPALIQLKEPSSKSNSKMNTQTMKKMKTKAKSASKGPRTKKSIVSSRVITKKRAKRSKES